MFHLCVAEGDFSSSNIFTLVESILDPGDVSVALRRISVDAASLPARTRKGERTREGSRTWRVAARFCASPPLGPRRSVSRATFSRQKRSRGGAEGRAGGVPAEWRGARARDARAAARVAAPARTFPQLHLVTFVSANPAAPSALPLVAGAPRVPGARGREASPWTAAPPQLAVGRSPASFAEFPRCGPSALENRRPLSSGAFRRSFRGRFYDEGAVPPDVGASVDRF